MSENRFLTREQYSTFERVYLVAMGLRYQVANINSFGATLRGPRWDKWPPGAEIKAAMVYFGSRLVAEIPTMIVLSARGTTEFAVIFLGKVNSGALLPNRSRSASHPLSLPTAECHDPLAPDREISFLVDDLSLDGARLHTSSRNRLLFPGLILNLTINSKHLTTASIRGEVAHSGKSEARGVVSLGVRFLDMSPALKASLTPHLLPPALGADGSLCLRLVHSTEDYHRVLALRFDSARKTGSAMPPQSPLEMADVFDLRSHIVVAENQGELVGCVRVTSCPNDRDRFELDQSLAIPGSLIRKDTKEISQLSVSPKFENSDLAHRLIEKCVHICINLDAKHVVTSSVEGTLPLFRNLAFASVGALLVLDIDVLPHLKEGDSSIIDRPKRPLLPRHRP